MRAPISDGVANAGHFVPSQIGKHYNIAAYEGWSKDLPDIGPEGIAIHRPIKPDAAVIPVRREAGTKVIVFPVPE